MERISFLKKVKLLILLGMVYSKLKCSRSRTMQMAGFLMTAFILVLVLLYRRSLKHATFKVMTVNETEYELSLRYWELMRMIDENGNKSAGVSGGITTKLPNLWRPVMDYDRRNSPILFHRRGDDRILAQLIWGLELDASGVSLPMKNIYLPDSFGWWYKDWQNPHVPSHEDCPGNRGLFRRCSFFSQMPDKVDAVVGSSGSPAISQSLRFYFLLESPYVMGTRLERNRDLLATYYRGADVNTPYEKWVYFDPDVKFKDQGMDYSKGKSKMAAIFVSNCGPMNNRMGYVKELQKHVEVDVFGGCGTMDCPRSDAQSCFNMLTKEYRFYLSFENCNCRDYMTEKLFVNGFGNNVIPIVLGAHPVDYQAVSPEGSYLHVENFTGPKELATYMKHLADTPEEYNSYFRYKGTGRFIDTKFFCRICAMVHYADKVPPPPAGHLPQVWDVSVESNNSQMCLPSGQWYWNPKNSSG